MYGRRKQLSQNFLYNRKLIQDLVGRTSISKKDIVLEIGPGKGHITAELSKFAGYVLAVELDPSLVQHLVTRSSQDDNVSIFHQDILDFHLPRTKYKVFANVPFAIEGKIVRKLVDGPNPPLDAYLIIRKDLARRLSGIPRENQLSLKHKPWFEFSLLHQFRGSDFTPKTKVEVVLCRIGRKDKPNIDLGQRKAWEELVDTGFGHGERLKKNMESVMTKEEYLQMCRKLGTPARAKPSHLSFSNWLSIFDYLKLKSD